MRAWPVVLAVAACGRLGFDPAARTDDGGSDARDAGVDGPPCTFGPWSTPQPIAILSSTAGDFGGQVTADGLGYYFQSGRSGSQQLYVSHRLDRASTWDAPVMIAELDTANEQIEAAANTDLEIYFASTRPGGSAQCIWHAERASTTDPFGSITELGLCAAQEAVGPFASLDGLVLYYSTFETAPFGSIYESHRASRSDPFTLGTKVPGLEAGMKGYPYVTPDALTLYYEALGTGAGHHLYVATRADPAAAFGEGTPIPNVDDDSDNEDVSLTADGREIFFGSSRAGTMGDKDIFTASRACN